MYSDCSGPRHFCHMWSALLDPKESAVACDRGRASRSAMCPVKRPYTGVRFVLDAKTCSDEWEPSEGRHLLSRKAYERGLHHRDYFNKCWIIP
jgi:hypothetical protein